MQLNYLTKPLNQNRMEKSISEITKLANEKLDEFCIIYLRKAGIKGEITKNKLKWWGIKLKTKHSFGKIEHQLTQRGVNISPIFEINFFELS